MKVEMISLAADEVKAAWKLMPESERTPEMLADVAVQVTLDCCVRNQESTEIDSVTE